MNRKVLIVEDNPDMLECIAEELEHLGHEVWCASTAVAALQHLTAEPTIDLLLSDLQLRGGANGEALAWQALTLQPQLDVVIMTGFDISHLSKAGQARFTLLRKPYSLEQLSGAIADARTV
ncbi:response regulator [Chitiniphilus purpureus]|uniref:Response regulator n=1 Tax=Chitiniphilus purpureus TaxID=2981137 RepID=A0ABY6DLW9_9NEIS|nr:response regulator [Chitiniphilus sp. CD1]UXY15370.1 response regulator [Chitiniphilus sp. CD1]